MLRKKLWIILLGLNLLINGCAFQSTAKDWNGVMGFDGKPAYYTETRKVTFNLLIMVPFLGNSDIDGMVEKLTSHVAEMKGSNARIVQGSSENYWYGFPPATWVVTPIVTTVSAEYTPIQEKYITDQQAIRDEVKNSDGLNPLKW